MNLEEAKKLIKEEVDYLKKHYDRRQANAYICGVLNCLIGTRQLKLDDNEFDELLKYKKELFRETFN